MSQEVRYAILIGINDYTNDPLKYCVNDVNSMEEALIKYCMYRPENIFKITSSNEDSLKDVTGRYIEYLRAIKEKFKPQKDSMFFYFAGHGSEERSKSMLWFQNSSYLIEDLVKNINELQPKVQSYIFDTCNSGNKVLTRSSTNDISNFINHAKGTIVLYACRANEYAHENDDVSHGLLTNNILDCILDRDSYDSEGYLTFGRIIDYVQKKTTKESGFTQTPVTENHIDGFYPFAVWESEGQVSDSLVETTLPRVFENKDLKNLRESIQDECIRVIKCELDSLNFEGYSVNDVRTLNDLADTNIENVAELKKEIVCYAEENSLISLNNIITQEEVKIGYAHLFGAALSVLNNLQDKPDSYVNYTIDFDSKGVYSQFKVCNIAEIDKVSFGIGCIFYQAKWGAVVLSIAYLIDWDGEEDNQITNINLIHTSIPLKTNSIEVLKTYSLDIESFLNPLLTDWNNERFTELNAFKSECFM